MFLIWFIIFFYYFIILYFSLFFLPYICSHTLIYAYTATDEHHSGPHLISALQLSHSEKESEQFLEPLEEYSRLIASIKTTLQQRQQKKATYLAAIQDLDAKTMASKKLTSQSSSSAGNPGGAGAGAGISAKEEQVLKVKLEQINVAQEVILIFFNIKKQMI